ncbi:MAG: DUF4383 domain-containing protein [Geodermatophilaceae bacterium]|nr:DUF4383 domain-containing protein [Geodermatophilaceae bacterium]
MESARQVFVEGAVDPIHPPITRAGKVVSHRVELGGRLSRGQGGSLQTALPPRIETGSTSQPTDDHVVRVHRIGALLVAATIAGFGLLGLAGGLEFFSTQGQSVAGLSSNGLLSTVSLLTAAVLLAAAARSGRLVSTVMTVVGVLFLLSALGHFFLLGTDYNILAFEISNIFFSMGAGLVLLLLGTYARVSGRIPHDNPYYLDHHRNDPVQPQQAGLGPATPAEVAAEAAMADAERAAATGLATADQRLRVSAMARVRTSEDRRQVWMSHDLQTDG